MAQHGRTTVLRLPERGRYDRATLDSILDEAMICHVGLVHEDVPVVLPTLFVRIADEVYFHGSPASAMLRSMKRGARLCLTATLVDGLVLARSAFHHSLNYRSAVVLGQARLVDEPGEKASAMEALVDKVIPGRSGEAREPSAKELKATLVMALAVEEFSCKVRSGPPLDDEDDYSLPVWAGVLGLRLVPGDAIPDERLVPAGLERAPYVDADRWYAASTRG